MTGQMTVPLPGGGQINARFDGPRDAPLVVFSNSVATDLSIWKDQVAALSGRYRVLRYDQRGHGASSVPEGPMSFDDYGADLLALLDACDVTSCTFVGLSMGAPTGLAALAARPERFSAFVVVDGVARSGAGREAFWTERRETARAEGMVRIATDTVARWLPGIDAEAQKAQDLTAMIAATPVEGYAAATQALQSYDYSAVLPSLTCPFLGIAGEKDGAMPETIRAQFSLVPNAQFTEIPGAGHVPNFQEADAFNAALLAFLGVHAAAKTKELR
ncbi:alpha/beta fold hydrolase [Roseibium marinum]|uniref:3-oxoadipate enol-lactonase n=1 Tax=Roseibium marinum TaxID=281252 RepID=A0A2S3UXD1_9HYPH|nr:alpha/beta fold hydrolase [Roseibium marinum]POF32183.1 3-oxoadipate enol-lactonase [Roseibium marinum]